MTQLKNKEVLALYYALPALGNLKGVKFNYGVDKNRKRLKEEVDLIEKRIKASEDYEKYDKERIKLNEEYSQKNEDGTAKMVQTQQMSRYIIDEKRRAEFDKKQADLKVKHKEAVEEREEQIKEYREFLENANTSFVPFLIKFEVVPEDVTGDQFEIISSFIQDDEIIEEKTDKEEKSHE